MSDNKDLGASATADRATRQSPRPSVSALRASITGADERAIIVSWLRCRADMCLPPPWWQPWKRHWVASMRGTFAASAILIEAGVHYARDLRAETAAIAQAIEARRAETQSGSVHESAVGNADAPVTPCEAEHGEG